MLPKIWELKQTEAKIFGQIIGRNYIMEKIFQKLLTTVFDCVIIYKHSRLAIKFAGVVQWLESQPSKLVVWVRFPSPAP